MVVQDRVQRLRRMKCSEEWEGWFIAKSLSLEGSLFENSEGGRKSSYSGGDNTLKVSLIYQQKTQGDPWV